MSWLDPFLAGKNAYTRTLAAFTQPNVSSNVTAVVAATGWMVVGQPVFVGGGGVYSVIGVVDGTHVVLQNTGASGNASPGATIASGSGVSPSGPSGVVVVGVTRDVRANLPVSGSQGALYYCTDYPVHYVGTGSGWSAYLGSTPIVEPNPASDTNWAWINQGTSGEAASVTQNGGGLYISVPATVTIGTTPVYRYFGLPISGNDGSSVTVGAWFENSFLTGGNNRFPTIGAGLWDDSHHEAVINTQFLNSNSTDYKVALYQANMSGNPAMNAPGSLNQNLYNVAQGGVLYLRTRRTGSRFYMEATHQSPNAGAIWTPIVDNSIAGSFTTKPNRAGIVVAGNADINSAIHVFHCEVVSG